MIQLEIPVNSGARSPTIPPTCPVVDESEISDGWALTAGVVAVGLGFVAATEVSCCGLTAVGSVGAWVVSAGTADSVGAEVATAWVGSAERLGWDWDWAGFVVVGLSAPPPQAAISKVIAAIAATTNGTLGIK